MFPLRLHKAMPGVIMVSAFVVSRIFFFLKGGAFLAAPLSFAMQFLDPLLLKNDLFRSLLYQHSQPPLFNLFLGLVLKISPVPSMTWDILFKTAGLLMLLLLYSILKSIGIKRYFALAATLAFMCNPTLILYENLLYYTYFEALFVLLAVFFLLRWGMEKRFYDLMLFWIWLLCLGLMRSMYQPVFFLVIAGILAVYVYRRFKGQRAAGFFISSFIVLVPLCILCLKNVLLFGFFGTSSWAGMSLWTKVNGYAPEQLSSFYSQGVISSLAVRAELRPFQPIENIFNDAELNALPCHHAADCNARKSTGKPNFNHIGYISLSKQLWKDAGSLILHDPPRFAFDTLCSYCLTLWHSSDSVRILFRSNMKAVESLERFYRFLYCGFMGAQSRYSQGMWLRTVFITTLFLFVYATTIINIFRKNSPVEPAVAIVCIFCILIHSYTLIVSSLVEFGENNRFRFPVDSAFLVLMAGNVVGWRRKNLK